MQAVLTPIFATAAALLALAGAGKLVSPGGLLDTLDVLGVPGGAISARALGAFEVALGVAALILPGAGTAVGCACVYAIFTGALVRLGRVAPGMDCGCFGGVGASGGGSDGADRPGGAGGASARVRAGGAGGSNLKGRSERLAQAGAFRVGLNVVALAVCTTAAAVPAHGLAWLLARGALQSVATVAGIGGCVLCAHLCFTALPAAWAAYGGAKG